MTNPPTESGSETTCDYPQCNDPTTCRDGRGNHYCASDHLLAAANDIEPSELSEYEVEYDGIAGTFRETSREAAQRQWKHKILSRRRTPRRRQAASVTGGSGETVEDIGRDENADADVPTLTDIDTVSARTASALYTAGFETVADVAAGDETALTEVEGIGETRAETIVESATTLLDEHTEAP